MIRKLPAHQQIKNQVAKSLNSAFRRICLVIIAVALVRYAPAQKLTSAKKDSSSRLVVMSSFDGELALLRSETRITNTYAINGRKYYVGELAGKDVVLVLSGLRMVNAAMTAQTVLDHFDVSGIVFSGIAGGVNPNLNIGDVVVPAQWGEYQEQVFARETTNGWESSSFPTEFGNFGMMFPQSISVTRKGRKPDSEERLFWLPAAKDMLSVAKDVMDQVQLSNCTQTKHCLDHEPKVVIGGNGVSGPTFVDNAKYRDWVWRTFQTDALDTESAAVAHVAYVNDVPFIAFRSLSDLAGGGPGKNETAIFYRLAADNSAKAVITFLKKLPKPPIRLQN